MIRSSFNGQQRFGCAMNMAVWWLVLGLLYVLFDGYLLRQHDPNRNWSSQVRAGTAELVLKQNREGHYVFPGFINDHPVRFIVDTGATTVAIPAYLGSTLNLVLGATQRTITANGAIMVHTTLITELRIGPFRLRNVRANLNPGLEGDQILLGMSVLRKMEFTQHGDVLILRLNRD